MAEFNIQIFCAGYKEERELKMLVPFPTRVLVNGEQVWEATDPVVVADPPEEIESGAAEEVSFGEAQKAMREKLRVQVCLKGKWFECQNTPGGSFIFGESNGTFLSFSPYTAAAWRIMPTTEAKPGNGASDSTVWTGDEES